ncbi:MAG TPA: hypothetical protein DEP45_03895 [Armatimonadetes bacterium]|nr:hypothetical protein [Armatimonadota bacterium]
MELQPGQQHCLILLICAHALLDQRLRQQPQRRPLLSPMALWMGILTLLCEANLRGLVAGLIVLAGYTLIHAISGERRMESCGYLIAEQVAATSLLVASIAYLAGPESGAWLARLAGLPLQGAAVLTGMLFMWWTLSDAVGLLARQYLPEDKGGDLAGTPGAGALIGRLERALILVLVLANVPSGIGFLIAAKSVLRFGEVTQPGNRSLAEYVLIGTLASFALGVPVAYATAALVHWAGN